MANLDWHKLTATQDYSILVWDFYAVIFLKFIEWKVKVSRAKITLDPDTLIDKRSNKFYFMWENCEAKALNIYVVWGRVKKYASLEEWDSLALFQSKCPCIIQKVLIQGRISRISNQLIKLSDNNYFSVGGIKQEDSSFSYI